MAKLLLTALAAATIVLCSQARAFDGNDRLLSVDKYQALPANHSEIPNSYDVAEYRPYGSQVGAFEQLGEAIDSLFSPEPTYVQEPVAYYRPLDGTVRHSSYHLRRPVSRETARETYGYRSSYQPRNYGCVSRVTGETELPRVGLGWAKAAARKMWRREVTARYGAEYAVVSMAKGVRWDCGGGLPRCQLSAIPCRAS
jgi:hypothetical protein